MKSTTQADDRSARPIWRDQVFWFAIALGVGYGGIYNFLPATFPIFVRQFGSSLPQMGQIQLLFFFSSLGFSAIGGSFIHRFGLKYSAMVACVIAATAMLVVAEAPRFFLVLIGAVMFGFAISAMVVIDSSIVARHFTERRQSVFLLTGLSDAGGSMIGPAALGWWLANSTRWGMSWRIGYFFSAAAMGALLLWALLVRSPTLKREPPSEFTGQSAGAHTREVLASGALYVAVVLGFCHGLAQAGMLSFIGQLYVHKLKIDAARAAYFLSGNAAGILSGRFLFGWITARWKVAELVMIGLCAAAETVAFLGAILAPNYIAGLVMYILAGVFVSTIGPSLNSYLGGKFVKGTATAFALFAGLSNLGAAFGPFIIGMIGANAGVAQAILFAPVFSILLSTLALLWFLRERVRRGRREMTVSALPG